MSNQIKKIEINDRELTMTYIDNQWWVAVKPICEALGVDYSRQLRTLKEDKIFSQLWSLETIVAQDLKKREMACLPEKFIYGWIFSLQSESELLLKYKLVCYEVLYNHFHGVLGQRGKLLKEKTLKEIEYDEVKKSLENSEEYLKLKKLEKEIATDKKSLNGLDSKYVATQLELW